MQIRTILFATDFSENSEAALNFAASLARDNHAKLLIIHVHEPRVGYAEGLAAAYAPLTEDEREDAERLLQRVKPPTSDIETERRLVTGSPAHAIVEIAKEEDDVDLIVLGSHGRTGLTRLVMGSVAESVVRTAECPVLTVKQPSDQTAPTTS